VSEVVRRRPPDHRLALAAGGAWIATWWASAQGWAAVGALAVLLLTAAVVGLALGRYALARSFGFAAASASLVLLPLTARLHGAQTSALHRLAASGVAATVVVQLHGDPRPLALDSAGGAGQVVVDAGLVGVQRAARLERISGEVVVFAPSEGWAGLLPGQRVRLEARLGLPRGGGLLAAVVSGRSAPEPVGRPPWWQRAAGAVRAGMQRACATIRGPAGGLLPGLVEGDTSRLDPVLVERFRVAGLTHLVAVSGTNCSIVVGGVTLLLRRLRCSPRLTLAVSAVVLVGFVILARPSPSVLRAAVMAGIGLAGVAWGRERDAVPVLGGSVILLLAWRPALAGEAGFLLSVLATLSLLLVAPGWTAALRRMRVPELVASPVAVAAAAHLLTAPVVAAISGRFSVVAIPANVLAEPAVAPATILGLAVGLVSVPCLPLATLVAQLAAWPCRWLVVVGERFGSLPGATVPWPSGTFGAASMLGVAALAAVVLRRSTVRFWTAALVAVAVIVDIPVRTIVTQWPARGWLVVACDVGQGDAIAVAAGPGSALVIDAGPDPLPVDRCLRGLGVTRVPLLVLTHFHADHVNGLAGVLRDRRVGAVMVSPLDEPPGGRDAVVRRLASAGLVPQVAAPGRLTVGSGPDHLDVAVLGPSRRYRQTRSDPNNSSVVLKVTTHGHTVLLPGDAEVEAQQDLLTSGVDLSADVLKVPHHGSAYFDPDFLAAVHPRLALISVGAGNDYGHPATLLLRELVRLGVAIHRTDLEGDLAVTSPDGDMLRTVVNPHRLGSAVRPVQGRLQPGAEHAAAAERV
jgi:competence protein ComEC